MEHTVSVIRTLKLSRLIVFAFICLLAGTGTIQAADDNLNIVFTTTDAGGSYGDRHVHVVWVTDTSDNFVYTAGTNVGIERTVWANARKYSLTTWWGTNPSGQADIDARTGATQTGYRTYNINWNFRRKNGTEVPDGTYRLYFECTNSDSGFPRNYTYFTITKGGSGWSLGPVSQDGYQNVTLTFTPGFITAPAVINLPATNLTEVSARLNGEITDTGSENPNVLIYWGDNDGATSPGAWDDSVDLGAKGMGTFFTDLAGLNPDTQYYFRCYAQNSAAGTWADSTATFTTLPTIYPDIELDPCELSFPIVDVGNDSNLTFQIRNVGLPDLEVKSITIVGLDSSAFTLVSPPTVPFILTNLASQLITVRFTPSGALTHIAQIAVISDDPDEALLPLLLSGQGGPVAAGQLTVTGGIGGHCRTVALRGQDAFIGQGAVLTILDVSNPNEPNKVGATRLPDVIEDIVAVGDKVYVAGGASGLFTVDTTDLSSPELVDVCDTDGHAHDIAVSGYVLALADGPGGLKLFDISTPNLPQLSSVYQTQGSAMAVASLGSYTHVLDEQQGLVTLLVLPGFSMFISLCPDVEFGQAIELDSTKAYITDRLGSFFVIDVSNPFAPLLRGQTRLNAPGNSIAISGTYVYVAAGDAGTEIVDVSDPDNPLSIGSIPTTGDAIDLTISVDDAFVAGGAGGLRVIDISNPLATLERGAYTLGSSPYAVAVDSNIVFTSKADSGLQALDISSPADPNQVGTLESLLLGDIQADYKVNFIDYSLLAQDWLGSGPSLLGDIYKDDTVDYKDLRQMVLNWLVEIIPGEIRGIAISNQKAYIANGLEGLQIVDISNPSSPILLGSFLTDGFASAVAVSGNIALVADGVNVYVLDVTDGRSPALTDIWSSNGWAGGVAIDGSYGYVANGGYGLMILDLSVPSNVTEVASYQTPGVAYTVTVSGSTAYVADGPEGLQIINVSTPSSPTPISSFDTAGTALNVAVSGSKAYVADGSFGLSVIDITTPASPVLDAISSLPVRSWSTDVSGSQIIIADDLGGLLILAPE
ncbi:MAG: hypothetical protein ACYSWP_03510 [Planctomycetota bacterium]|jgi:hypothetical protein